MLWRVVMLANYKLGGGGNIKDRYMVCERLAIRR